MLMVIFGAGASFDALSGAPVPPSGPGYVDPHAPVRLPLAAQLFDPRFGHILDSHPDCQALFPRLRRAAAHPDAPIEQELERISEDAGRNPDVARQLLSLRYYLREAIQWSQGQGVAFHHGVTNYADLLHQISTWAAAGQQPVCYVTFNYDTLLDDACRSAYGVTFESVDSYVRDIRFNVFKVHGSVSWWRCAINVRGSPVASADQLQLTDDYEIAITQKGPDIASAPEGVSFVPAIAVPTVTKRSFECPRAHLAALAQILSGTTKVLAIGWRGAEQHFLRMWREAIRVPPERLHVVSGTPEGASQALQNLHKGLGAGATNETFSAEGFSGFVAGDTLRDFLSDDR